MSRAPQAVFLVFTFAYFVSYFYRSANAILANEIADDLALTTEQFGIMTSLFFAAFAAVQLPLGYALDRWRAHLITASLMMVGAVGSLIFATAGSFVSLSIGRVLIGVGMSGVLTGALKVLPQVFPPSRFATVSGLLVGGGASGALFAATPLAWLSELYGWRAVFTGSAVVVLLSAFAIVFFLRSLASNRPAPSARSLGESQGFSEIFRNAYFWRIAPLSFVHVGVFLAVQSLWGGPYLFDVIGLSSLQAGNVLLLMAVGMIAGFTSSGWLGDTFGLARMIFIAASGFVCAQVTLAFLGQDLPLPALYLVYLVFGYCGSYGVMILALARRLFPPRLTGRAVTTMNLFGFSGVAVVQSLMGFIIGSFGVSATGAHPPEAYTTAFGAMAVFAFLAVLWYLPVLKTDPHP